MVTQLEYLPIRGVAVLPLVLLIGGIIFEVAIVGGFIVYYAQQTGASYRWQVDATAAAQAGIQDAFLKIIRDNSYLAPTSYTLSVNGWNVSVSVTNTNGVDDIVTAVASAPFRGGVKLQSTIRVNIDSHEVRRLSTQSLSL